jgi:hypothetical protein
MNASSVSPPPETLCISNIPQKTDKNNVGITEEMSGKVKLPLGLCKYHTIKTYRGMEIQLHAFLTMALDGCECSASPLGKEPQEPII